MSINTLSQDLLAYSESHGKNLSRTQAHALAVLNCKAIKGERYTKSYWRQIGHIVNVYLTHQTAEDKIFGVFHLATA